MSAPEQRPSVRELTIQRNTPQLHAIAKADSAFQRFLGNAVSGLFPAKDWKPYPGARP